MSSEHVKNIRAGSVFFRPEIMISLKNGSKGKNVEAGSGLNERENVSQGS